MNALKAETSARQDDSNKSATEGHIRNIVRGKAAVPEIRSELTTELSSDTIGLLIQKVGAASIAEIDNLIVELQTARGYLKSEADRIEREMTRYAQLSNTASASVKVITQSLAQWRNAEIGPASREP